MQTTTCDGCGRCIADDDAEAVRRIPGMGRGPDWCADWCGECVGIVRRELPKWAAQEREARRAAAAEPVRSRALRLWERGGRSVVPPPQGGQMIVTSARIPPPATRIPAPPPPASGARPRDII